MTADPTVTMNSTMNFTMVTSTIMSSLAYDEFFVASSLPIHMTPRIRSIGRWKVAATAFERLLSLWWSC